MLTTYKLELLIILSSARCPTDLVKPLVSENWSLSITDSIFAGAVIRAAVFCALVNFIGIACDLTKTPSTSLRPWDSISTNSTEMSKSVSVYVS